MPILFLNYGGPGGRWYAQDEEDAQELKEACAKCYHVKITEPKKKYTIKGITATI